jgi:hypothetical protein
VSACVGVRGPNPSSSRSGSSRSTFPKSRRSGVESVESVEFTSCRDPKSSSVPKHTLAENYIELLVGRWLP